MVESDPTASDGQQPPSLSIVVDRDGDESVVTVGGDIDLETSAELGAVLGSLDSPGVVNVDLGAVTYIDSTGLRVLLTAREALSENGGHLRVSATSNIVARLLEITGVGDLLE